MKGRGWNRIVALLLAVSFIWNGSLPISYAAESHDREETAGVPLKDKYTGFDGEKVDWSYGTGEDTLSYKEYRKAYQDVADADAAIEVSLNQVKDKNGSAKLVQMEGKEALLSDRESDYVEFDVRIPSAAWYQLEIEYYLTDGSSDAGKRTLYIDGEYPFTESSDIAFYRYFKDEGEPVLNSLGDETRPSQIAMPGWRKTLLEDTSGMYNEPFQFYLDKGEHTFRLAYMRADMYISSIRLVEPKTIKSYEEVRQEYVQAGYRPVQSEKLHIQAELTAVEKNNPTLRRENDGDPLVEPASDTSRRLNVMGGYRWRSGNQSITW